MKNKIYELYALESLSNGDTFVHKLHPTVKILTAAAFIVAVVSFDRCAFGRMAPFVIFPALLTALSETPFPMLFKRYLIAVPFCLFAGISNIIFDRTAAFTLFDFTVTNGAVSFFVILLRAYLCVASVLLLVASTRFSDLTDSMRRLKIPAIFVTLFEMTYRYIGVLLDEAFSMYAAYALRGAGGKGVRAKDAGTFAGQLLLRSFGRAERVYDAMRCRGCDLNNLQRNAKRFTRRDFIFLTSAFVSIAALRFADINAFYEFIFTGLT